MHYASVLVLIYVKERPNVAGMVRTLNTCLPCVNYFLNSFQFLFESSVIGSQVIQSSDTFLTGVSVQGRRHSACDTLR
jgi:hypothetical protein